MIKAPATAPPVRSLNLIGLSRETATGFDIALRKAERAAAARFMDIREVGKAQFGGKLTPWRKTGWRLDGRLDAVAVQDCVITLAPVVQCIREDVTRFFLPEDETAAAEASAYADRDAPDPVGDRLDIAAVMLESLTLALDPYPRVVGAKLKASVFSPPGVAPMTDAGVNVNARAFAKLATLKSRLTGEG